MNLITGGPAAKRAVEQKVLADLESRVRGGAVTAKDFTKVILCHGRNAGPGLMATWFANGWMTREQLRDIILDVWTSAEYPLRGIGISTWVALFTISGFVSDTGAPKPTEPFRIYRGATSRHRRGMSWTTNPERAEWFAQRWGRFAEEGTRFKPAMVFSVVIDPNAVLALADDPDGRREAEVVVDPSRLPRVTAWKKGLRV